LLVTSGKTAEISCARSKDGQAAAKGPVSGKPVAPEKDDEEVKTDEAGAVKTKPDKGAQLSFTGLTFSPDGSRIYVSNVAAT
jgi:hypothetical protein